MRSDEQIHEGTTEKNERLQRKDEADEASNRREDLQVLWGKSQNEEGTTPSIWKNMWQVWPQKPL